MSSSTDRQTMLFVCNTNIENFNKSLARTTDHAERKKLHGLLAEEQAKLLAMQSQRLSSDRTDP